MAAYGTPALGSRGLCTDVDTPDFIDRLPDDVSPVTLAEAIEYRLANPIDGETREAMRSEYLARKSPAVYARVWFDLLSDVARTSAPGEA